MIDVDTKLTRILGHMNSTHSFLTESVQHIQDAVSCSENPGIQEADLISESLILDPELSQQIKNLSQFSHHMDNELRKELVSLRGHYNGTKVLSKLDQLEGLLHSLQQDLSQLSLDSLHQVRQKAVNRSVYNNSNYIPRKRFLMPPMTFPWGLVTFILKGGLSVRISDSTRLRSTCVCHLTHLSLQVRN